MENPFKKLWQPHQEVPKEIKERVKNDIALYNLFGEFADFRPTIQFFHFYCFLIADLVTNNYGEAAKSLLKNQQSKNNKNGKTKQLDGIINCIF